MITIWYLKNIHILSPETGKTKKREPQSSISTHKIISMTNLQFSGTLKVLFTLQFPGLGFSA